MEKAVLDIRRYAMTPMISGWKPDIPDFRDYAFSIPKKYKKKRLPRVVDLRKRMPPVYDQGNLGSCTAQAIAGAIQYMHRKQTKRKFRPSPLFIYYNERVLEGTINQDAGAMIRTGIKTVHKQGTETAQACSWAVYICDE